MEKIKNRVLPRYLREYDLYDASISKTNVVDKVISSGFEQYYPGVAENMVVDYEHVVTIAGIRVIEEERSAIDDLDREYESGTVLRNGPLRSYEFDKYLTSNENFARIIMLMNGIEERQLNLFAEQGTRIHETHGSKVFVKSRKLSQVVKVKKRS